MKILVRVPDPAAKPEAWIGGHPLAPPDLEWPHCQECEGAMQFIAQIDLSLANSPEHAAPDQWLLLFQCQNDQMCNEWDPEGGANAALRVPRAGAARLEPPGSEADDRLAGFDPMRCEDFPGQDFGSESEAYAAAIRQKPDQVLGKVGGQPQWMVDDETPVCQCGEPMRFAVQLEEGRELTFGGGWGLAFICDGCPDQARFLWQQSG